MNLQVMYVCKHMSEARGTSICNHKKLKGLSQIFEESDEGDRQMGFDVVHCCYFFFFFLSSHL